MRTPTVRKRLGCIYALITFTMMMLMPQGIGPSVNVSDVTALVSIILGN